VSEAARPVRSTAWRTRFSLTRRILAVNIFAPALLAGGFFYLDSYRTRIIDARIDRMSREVSVMAAAMEDVRPSRRDSMIARFANVTGYRVRLYAPDGSREVDSVALGVPHQPLVDPASEPINLKLARILDKAVDSVVFARIPPAFAEPTTDKVESWPEAKAARRTDQSVSQYRLAPDRTPVLSVAIPFEAEGSVLLATENARDITMTVRNERLRISLVLAAGTLTSIFLSLFLARTIVLPLRRLARAAIRVRLGRAREVVVPRLPDRRDEIGLLARAISDMSQALRKRIDATDSFAADVSHELKNPIASLRSALEGLDRIGDTALRKRLLDIAQDDVLRIDRLVTDIAEASRIDAQLSRTPFKPIDFASLVERLVRAREMRGLENDVKLRLTKPSGRKLPPVMGEEQRLARVIDNLVDNAISFSPPGGSIFLNVGADADWVILSIEDEGPGVSPDERESVFRRFHSVRPDDEDFGKHSGLGLAIARSIVEAHNGTISIEDRSSGTSGACFIVRLPLPGQDFDTQ
jgi:two-component system sensor histidine kinase ChvG